MDDYRFYDEIRIPPREEIRARLLFEGGSVYLRFFAGSRNVDPAQLRDPRLRRAARLLRGDGTLSVGSCVALLSELETAEKDERAPITVEWSVYSLTPIEPPVRPIFNFVFNGKDALMPLMQAQEKLFFYDGEGVFVAEDGLFFSLPETRIIDPYLTHSRMIPAMAFSMFYRRAYPALEKEERFRLYSSLRMVSEPPFKVSARITEEGRLAVNMNWCIPYAHIRFFANAGMLCECHGDLRPCVPTLATLPHALQREGEFFPDRTQYALLMRLSRAIPEGFSSPLPPYPAPPAHPSAKPASGKPVPGKKAAERQTIVLPGGITVEKTPAPPVFNNRGEILERFIRTYGEVEGEPVPICSFSAFSPNWFMMDESQRKSYLYLRSLYEKGEEAPHAGYAYLLLLIYEALNRPNRLEFLFCIWEANREEFRRLDMLMPALVRDYIVLQCPETPLSVIYRRVKFDLSAVGHPELYMDLKSEEGLAALTPGMLTAMTGYDATKSKFYRPEKAAAFHEAFQRALCAADRALRAADGKGLFESHRARELVCRTTACSAAVMTAENSCDLLYRFESSFYDPGLREEMCLLVKAAENELRAAEGVKGKLRTAGLRPLLQEAVREAFRERKKTARVKVDISSALSIEKASWETTDKLIAAAGTGESPEEEKPAEEKAAPPPTPAEELPETALSPYEELAESLSDVARGYLRLLAEGAEEEKRNAFAASAAVMPETLEEEINEKASELTGDILIENGEIIEDYRAELVI